MIAGVDFDAHNAEVDRVWKAYRAGKPSRVPMILGVNPRYTMFDHPANPEETTFEQYFEDPSAMIGRQLEHADWCAHHLPQDARMGRPDKWNVYPDYQNIYEAAAWGCPIRYFSDQVPDTDPAFTGEDGKASLLAAPIPDPMDTPFFRRVWNTYDFMKQCEVGGYTYEGRPVAAGPPSGMGTDGPFTVCCNLRGTSDFCLDLVADQPAAQAMLEKVTDFIILHIQAFRRRVGEPLKTAGWGFADDSIALISTQTYLEAILPHHRRLMETFSEGGPNSIHLCGDATRHFPSLKRELNVMSFDTGFPVDFALLRESVGEEVEILGGPSTPFLCQATPDEVRQETRRILESGIMLGGRFILREGNNLPPDVGVEKVQAMYDTVRECGLYGVEP